MKWLFLLLLPGSMLLGQLEVELPVTHAELYQSGATVIRSSDVTLSSGEQTITVIGLPKHLDPSTISVMMGSGSTILSQKVKSIYVDHEDIIARYSAEKQAVLDSIALHKEFLKVMEGEERILDANVEFLDSDQQFTAADVSALRENYRNDKTAIVIRKAKQKVIIRKLNQRLDKLIKQIREEGSQSKDAETHLVLEIDADRARTVQLEVEYFITQAGWTPTYDLRVIKVDEPLQIIYKANVFQNTKEDWKDVDLSLSTATPSRDQTLPELSPYYLSFNNHYSNTYSHNAKHRNIPPGAAFGGHVYDHYGEPLIGANVLIKGTTIGTITDLDGSFYFESLPGDYSSVVISYTGYETLEYPISRNIIARLLDAELLDEVVVTGAASGSESRVGGYALEEEVDLRESYIPPTSIEKSQTSISYDLDTPISIPSSLEEQSVMIRSERVNVDLSYIAVPKLIKNAFLTARITDWSRLQILPGMANIYLSNRYVGQTYLSEPISEVNGNIISLGQDREVYVDRTLATDFAKTKWLGKNKVDIRKWNLKVVNNKEKVVDITIRDQYPISKRSEIDVDLKETSDALVNKDLGKLEWKFSLSPDATRQLTLMYEVKYPREKRLIVD